MRDPACDLTVTWTTFSGEAREVFGTGMGLDDGIWGSGQWLGAVEGPSHLRTGARSDVTARVRFGWRWPVADVIEKRSRRSFIEGRRSIVKVMSDLPPGAIPGRAVDRSVEDFDESYAGTPPWNIGRPQPVFAALLEEGAISGRVLDAGCGTGEHTLMAAAHGLDATGIDASPRAIEIAKSKANDRGVAARFVVWDALALADLNEEFDTVLDSGLFHVFDDERRALYVTSLAAAVRPRGRVFIACFSDRQPGDWGPRRVRQADLRDAFSNGWVIESIEPVRFDTNLEPSIVEAWLARIRRAAT